LLEIITIKATILWLRLSRNCWMAYNSLIIPQQREEHSRARKQVWNRKWEVFFTGF